MNKRMVDALTVHLGARSYPLVFGTDLKDELLKTIGGMAKAGRKAVIVTDRNVARHRADELKSWFGDLPVLVLPAGEETKSLETLGRILDFMAAEKVDRSGALFAVGGGVVGDVAGFAAASWLRGVDFYQVPTTLLAMVDSSVGGKTGINLKAGKNLVGAFHQPRGVFIATRLLSTLPAREFAAGMAEVIKYGLLGDAKLFAQLEAEPLQASSPQLAAVIRRCCEMKAAIVQADEFETAAEGGRALLNLGHTFGHAIEQVTGYGEYLHGEAVAIGLNAATRLSVQLGLLGAAETTRVERVLAAHALPVRLNQPLKLETLLGAMARDKKVRAGLPRFVVLKKIGDAATQAGINPVQVETVWREVGAV